MIQKANRSNTLKSACTNSRIVVQDLCLYSIIVSILVTLLVILIPLDVKAQSNTVDPEVLQQLKSTIQQQQELLKQQAEQIRLQSERLNEMQRQIDELQNPISASTSTASGTSPEPKQQAEVPLQKLTPKLTISSGNDRVKLSLSGQVNRALNIVNDGHSTGYYPVDNNASNSRIRLIGNAKIDEDLSIGTRIEFAVAPDVSTEVSQIDRTPGTWFDQRWTEISLISNTYGKLSIGKGDTASNTTAEVDFSRTDVVQYSRISDIAGGLLFRQRGNSATLTTLKVSDVFHNRDGLSRQSRVRYDTPQYYGFSLAGSLVTQDRYDAGIYWNNKAYGFKAGAAFALSNPKLPDSGLQYDGSLSILHLASGLNLTLSSGLLERDSQKNASNIYGKLGWIAILTKLGSTAFGVDYTKSQNLPSSRDTGSSFGMAAVQSFDKYATEFYMQYRIYSLDLNSEPTVDNINVGTLGLRVKF